jgi:hypothetical protein
MSHPPPHQAPADKAEAFARLADALAESLPRELLLRGLKGLIAKGLIVEARDANGNAGIMQGHLTQPEAESIIRTLDSLEALALVRLYQLRDTIRHHTN